MTYNITLTANHQSLTTKYLPLAAESVQYLTAKVVYETDDWTGREIKAMFEHGHTVYEVPVIDGEITAKQQLNLTAGDWRVWLVGNSARDGDVIPRITTNVAHIIVAPTGGTEGSPFPTIPPTVEEQLRADMGNLADLTTEDKSSLVAAINEVRQTGGGGVQPDWNQNDESAPDYVKNRPFYTGDPVETVLVEESTVSFSEVSGGIYHGELSSTFSPTIGETYKVSWDGTVYECACVDFRGGTVIGNLSITGAGSDTGEPFIMDISNGARIIIFTADTSASHTFSISSLVAPVKKIDEKYLPELPYMDKVNPTGTGSFSLNRKANTTIGNYSFTEGYDTTASGDYSHAEGKGTTASGDYSHAEGYYTTASGLTSYAEGESTTASGYSSHAEGYYTTASGDFSHAEGLDTTASGNSSHAEGKGTTASGDYSHAEGYGTKASSKYQHVHGKYNIEDKSNTYAEIVGNGDQLENSNAHTLDWSGNAWYAGTVEGKALILPSSTTDSTKKFKITVDDSSSLTITDDNDETGATGHAVVGVPEGGTAGQLLGKTESGTEWVDPPQSGVQPDWNQNDDTQPDYIKNRPFYTGDPVETVFVEESTVSFASTNGIYMGQLESTFSATIGETYKVSWDGTIYECVAHTVNGGPGILGNLSIINAGEDTGEPFVYGSGQIGTTDTSASHTISISGIGVPVTKIDTKYIPWSDAVGFKPPVIISKSNDFTDDEKQKYFDAFKNGALVLYLGDENNAGVVVSVFYSKTVGFKMTVINAAGNVNIYNSSGGWSSNNISKKGIIGTINDVLSDTTSWMLLNSTSNSVSIGEAYKARIEWNSTTKKPCIYKETRSSTSGVIKVEHSDIFCSGDKDVILTSSTVDSTKKFKITVDDSGTITATEVT